MASPLADLARAFHKTRLKLGWSPEKLAQEAGVPVDAIVAYESDPEAISPELAIRLFDAVPPDPRDLPTPSLPPDPSRLANMEAQMNAIGAAFAIDKRDLSEALDYLERGLSYGPSRERAGELLISKAAVYAELGHEDQALEVLAQAQSCFDAQAEPKLWLRMRLEQLHLECQVQRFDRAAALIEETLELAARVGRDRERLEAQCLAGRIAAGSGRTSEALPLLQEAREKLLTAGKSREAAAVALDLGALFIEQRDPAALANLARELEALCLRKKLASSVRSRIKAFCWSVHGNRVDADWTRVLARELRRAIGRLRRPYELPCSSSGMSESRPRPTGAS
jgi:tetratricopeptide (TPR) repeat protein